MSDNLKLEKQLCFSLYNAQRQMNRYYSNKVFKKYNLTYPQYLILSVLWKSEPANVKTLVKELSLDTGTVSPLLKRMAANELITRVRSDEDQREVFIHLTDKSRVMQDELENITHDVQAIVDFSDEEFHRLQELLTKLIHNIKESR